MAKVLDYNSFAKLLAGSPMASESRSIYNAALNGGVNPAFVAGLAGAESSYGKAGYAVGTKNPFGLGVHLGWKFGSYAAATAKLAKTLNDSSYKSLYKQSGLAGVISQYTPASDGNNEQQHAANIVRYGGSTASNVYATGVPGLGPLPTVPTTATTPTGVQAPASKRQTSFKTTNDLMSLLSSTTRSLQRGGPPSAQYSADFANVASSMSADAAAAAPAATPATPAGLDSSTPLSGYPTGGVDTGRAYAGGTGGNWGGSMPLALALARGVGATPSSQKRSRQLTANGNNSDHWVGSVNSYAIDLPTSGAAGDKLLAKIAAELGVKLVAGSWNNINVGGYRWNIGWKVPGHFDHVHAGVKKL